MKKSVPVLISICMLLAAFLTLISCPSSSPSLIPMLIYQHKDTSLPCNPCIADPLLNPDPHAENHAAGQDGAYGTFDDCPHCSAYCAPASIAMIATAYRMSGDQVKQDWIYDAGKSTNEAPGDMIINTHGVGMYHGAGTTNREVQDALYAALGGMPFDERDAVDPLKQDALKVYIENRRPLLWLDHGGWPANQYDEYPSASDRQYQGHAKVIAGYDDRGTEGSSDDRCLIYDPWPEYNDKKDILLLPTGASKGPDDTFDPYWFPVSSIVGDANDVFLVPQNSIP